MDVLKDFELRQVGSRLVLRQICPPDFEMRTVIAADKIVEQKEDFFVLGYNEKFFCLCRYDKQNRCLCSKIGCDDYVRLGKKILFLQNMMWQLWDEDFQLHFLGESVDQKKTAWFLQVRLLLSHQFPFLRIWIHSSYLHPDSMPEATCCDTVFLDNLLPRKRDMPAYTPDFLYLPIHFSSNLLTFHPIFLIWIYYTVFFLFQQPASSVKLRNGYCSVTVHSVPCNML